MDPIVTGLGHESSIHAPVADGPLNTQPNSQLDSPTPSFITTGPRFPVPPPELDATAVRAMFVQLPIVPQSESFDDVQPDGQQPSPLTHPAGFPTQTPPLQVSPEVHAFESLHEAPSLPLFTTHCPVDGSQADVRHAPGGGAHATEEPPVHTPLWHVSPDVQREWSSQLCPSGMRIFAQPALVQMPL